MKTKMLVKYFKNKSFLISMFSLFIILTVPILSSAFEPLIQCDGSKEHPCNLNAFVDTINRIINWIISIAGVIFTISLVWGGFLYITSGVKPGNKEKAKSILTSTLYGFIVILISWLIVYTILANLVPCGSSIFRFISNDPFNCSSARLNPDGSYETYNLQNSGSFDTSPAQLNKDGSYQTFNLLNN